MTADLITAHLPAARRTARGVARRFPAAEVADLEQEASLGLILAGRLWDSSRGVTFWAFARHRVEGAVKRDAIRQAKARRPLLAPERDGGIGSIEADTSGMIVLLGTLSPPKGRIVYDRAVNGDEFGTIARALGCSSKWVQILYRRALVELREKLAHRGITELSQILEES